MWKEKLRALCEGLEIKNIDVLFENANINDFLFIGKIMAQRIKEIKSKVNKSYSK